MKIIVCIKQVPDTTDVRINPETNTLIREGVACDHQPLRRLRHGGRGAPEGEARRQGDRALSMGPPQAEAALREAIAWARTRRVLLSDRAFAGADTLATSYTLAAGIRKLGASDLILMGKQAIDGDTAQVGPGDGREPGSAPRHLCAEDRARSTRTARSCWSA